MPALAEATNQEIFDELLARESFCGFVIRYDRELGTPYTMPSLQATTTMGLQGRKIILTRAAENCR